jgi:hypothetical protein
MPHREFNRQLAVNNFLNQSFGKEQELQEVVAEFVAHQVHCLHWLIIIRNTLYLKTILN